MKNMLAFLAAAALALVGVGWYLGWYSVQTTTNAKGNHDVNIQVHDDKLKTDVKKGIKTGEREIKDISEKNRQNAAGSGSDSIPSSPPGLLPVPKGSSTVMDLPPVNGTPTFPPGR